MCPRFQLGVCRVERATKGWAGHAGFSGFFCVQGVDRAGGGDLSFLTVGRRRRWRWAVVTVLRVLARGYLQRLKVQN